MERALAVGETRMFQLLGEPDSMLVVVLGYSDCGDARIWIHLPVHFCPFCGTQLQTKEATDGWSKKHEEHNA